MIEFLTNNVFNLFALLTIISAFAVVVLPSVVHSAFSLMVTLFSVAGFYVFLHADFLAATQLIVYVGGILVLILFGVMMTSGKLGIRSDEDQPIRTDVWQVFGGVAISGGLLFILLRVVYETPWMIISEISESSESTANQIGKAILQNKFLLPFEVVSVILLIALIGAAMISRKEVKG